jgi:hypothetical protein
MELTRQGPSTRQSANHCHHGFITKAGNSLARWLLTQATRRAESCGIEYKGVEAWLEQLAQELRNKTKLREARLLNRGYTEVVDADLSSYFDTIPHHELMQSVARRVSDRAMLGTGQIVTGNACGGGRRQRQQATNHSQYVSVRGGGV